MSLTKKTTQGVKWSTLSTIVKTVVQIAKLSVLTFLLDKSDFGIIAIATMVINFTEIFANLGLAVGIIHKQNISQNEYSSLYWLNIFASIFVFIIMWLSAPLLVSFYNEPILSTIIPLLGLQVIFNAFGKIYQTIKTKELDFKFISKITVFSVVLGFLFTISLAYFGLGVFSLVYGQLLQVLINQAVYVYYGRKENKIRFYFSYKEIRSYIKIGVFQLGSQILDLISSKIDVFLIGKFFGMEILGIYNIAKELILKPYQLVNSLVLNVVSSAFSKIQENHSKIRENFLKALSLISFVSMPLYILTFVFAQSIVKVLYSPEFHEVYIFLRLMIFVGIGSSISSVSSILIISKGRTDIGFYWTLIRVIITAIAIVGTSQFGIYTVAITQSILSLIFVVIYWKFTALPLGGVSLWEYINSFIGSLLISLAIGTAFEALNYLYNSNLIFSIILMFTFAFLYLLYYWFFQKSFILNLVGILKGK